MILLQQSAQTGTAPFPDVDALVRDIVNQKSDFNGIGPRFGLTGDYHLGGGFGIIGSLSTSLLVGEIESRLHTRIDVEPVLPLAGEGTVDISAPVTEEEVTSLVAPVILIQSLLSFASTILMKLASFQTSMQKLV